MSIEDCEKKVALLILKDQDVIDLYKWPMRPLLM